MTGVMRGGRILKEYQGTGILGKLGREIIKQHPMIKYATFFTATNLDVIKAQINKNKYQLLCIRVGIYEIKYICV